MTELEQVLSRLDRIEGKIDAVTVVKAEHDTALALLAQRVAALEARAVEDKAASEQVTKWQGGLALLGGLAMLVGAIAALVKVVKG